jgi:hypothetical protein
MFAYSPRLAIFLLSSFVRLLSCTFILLALLHGHFFWFLINTMH